MSKISIIGAGHVGATTAFITAQKCLAEEIVLVDIVEGLPQGKGLDMFESGPVQGFSGRVRGTNDYEDIAGSSIVVMTAGIARKPGMSREDLLRTNASIVANAASHIKESCKDAIVIVVTNPLDMMTFHMWKQLGFPTERVVGQAGCLDTARYRTFIGEKLGVSSKDVSAILMGGHGDTMVPLPRYTTVAGIPLTDLMSTEDIEAIVKRARTGGGEIVSLLKTGSAYYAPAAATVEMVESIVMNQKRVLCCSCLLQGEFGWNDLYIGVPCILGKKGVEKIIELKLTPEEKALFDESAGKYKTGIEEMLAL